MVALSPPNTPSRKLSEPRPFALPSIASFNNATPFILECSLLHSPLRTHTLLYMLFPLLVVDLPPMLYVLSPLLYSCSYLRSSSGGLRSWSPSHTTSPQYQVTGRYLLNAGGIVLLFDIIVYVCILGVTEHWYRYIVRKGNDRARAVSGSGQVLRRNV